MRPSRRCQDAWQRCWASLPVGILLLLLGEGADSHAGDGAALVAHMQQLPALSLSLEGWQGDAVQEAPVGGHQEMGQACEGHSTHPLGLAAVGSRGMLLAAWSRAGLQRPPRGDGHCPAAVSCCI